MKAQSLTQDTPITQRQPNNLTRLWDKLTRPHPSITGIEKQRQSRLLAGIHIAIIISSFFGQMMILRGGDGIDWFLMVAMVFVLGLYGANRRGHYQVSAILTTLNHFLVIHSGLLIDGSLTWFLFSSTAVILAAIFLSYRLTLLVALASIIVQVVMATLQPVVSEFGNSAPLIVFIFTSSMILVFMNHRTKLEQERQAELQEANRRLRQSEIELEHRVEERTLELQSAKQELEVALQKAVKADQIKSQFLASMSHELRTPLNSILTFTDLMAMGTFGDVNDEQTDYLGKILFSGRHLLSLINDVLDITKIHSGMMKLFVEDDFDVVKEIEQVAATIEKQLADKPTELVMDVDQNIPSLSCDKRRVRQILLNLVSNAVKFTEEGTITLSAKHRDDEVHFAVMDTGPGIAADQQELIFQPFVQTETGIKHAGGTGLGLPITKELVQAHGGRLWLESTPGQGSAFHIALPLKAQEIEVAVQMGA